MSKSRLIQQYRQMFAKTKSPFRATQGDRRYEIKNESNEIIIYEEIGFWGVTASMVKSDLSNLSGDISVRINSPGGDVFDGMAIYNLLKQYNRGKVTTYNDGEAASAAGIFFLAGDERKAPEPSILMLHEAWAGIVGNKRDLRGFADILDEIDGQLLAVIMSMSSKDEDETSQAFEKEMWLSPQAAKDWGLVTEIITYNNDETYNNRPAFDLSVFSSFPEALFDTSDGDTPTRKNIEQALRQVGLSRNQAKAFYSGGKTALEPTDEDGTWAAIKSLELSMKGL